MLCSHFPLLVASFQAADYKHLVFPSEMRIDYVRVYQRADVEDGLSCDPPNYPTADYINECALSFFSSSYLLRLLLFLLPSRLLLLLSLSLGISPSHPIPCIRIRIRTELTL